VSAVILSANGRHPERSEGSAVRIDKVLFAATADPSRFRAQDDYNCKKIIA
jgi:hypothetical protein